MRKIILAVTVVFMMISSFSAYADGIDVQANVGVSLSTSLNPTLENGENAHLNLSVSGLADGIEGSLSMTLDGALMGIGGSGYSKKNLENASFVFAVPKFGSGSTHTVETKLTLSDGTVLTDSVSFESSGDGEKKLTFAKKPETHNPWTDVSYTIAFSCTDAKEYFVRGTGYVNGTYIPEIDSYYLLKNGDTIDVTVPAIYNNYYEKDFDFSFVLNVNGENQGFSKISLSTQGKKINPVVIPAYVKYNVTGTNGVYIPQGTWVEYMNPNNHNSMSSCKVKLPDGRITWIPMSAVARSEEDFTIPDDLTDSDREAFVNSMGYESKTPYLIWVNKERQRLTVFLGAKGSWKAVKTFPVATGKNATPSPTVVCEYTYRTRWVTPTYTCDPVLSLYDGYAIHNQPVSPSGVVTDKTIGKPASAGCVRMLQEDVNWVASYVPVRTTVVIY